MAITLSVKMNANWITQLDGEPPRTWCSSICLQIHHLCRGNLATSNIGNWYSQLWSVQEVLMRINMPKHRLVNSLAWHWCCYTPPPPPWPTWWSLLRCCLCHAYRQHMHARSILRFDAFHIDSRQWNNSRSSQVSEVGGCFAIYSLRGTSVHS